MVHCRAFAVITAAFLLLASGSALAYAQSLAVSTVLVTRIEGPIADHVTDAVAAAEKADNEALVVKLDTPGGLATSTQAIVEDFLSADVPVVVYATPLGAQATSAGTIVTLRRTSPRWRLPHTSAQSRRSTCSVARY
jgi:membrane-bound serine protease (ClpP class)